MWGVGGNPHFKSHPPPWTSLTEIHELCIELGKIRHSNIFFENCYNLNPPPPPTENYEFWPGRITPKITCFLPNKCGRHIKVTPPPFGVKCGEQKKNWLLNLPVGCNHGRGHRIGRVSCTDEWTSFPCPSNRKSGPLKDSSIVGPTRFPTGNVTEQVPITYKI